MIKYGGHHCRTTYVATCCPGKTLYLAGRMHKPIRIIKDDARVRLTQQVNLVSALRVALLTIPESKFDESILFERMAGFSYGGDPRMLLPAENRGKVSNIVKAQGPQFRELYQRLANGLPGVHWGTGSSIIEVRASPVSKHADYGLNWCCFTARHLTTSACRAPPKASCKLVPPSRVSVFHEVREPGR